MIRKLLVPLAATALLAGCVTSAPYGYRGQGSGDYYYGAPSVDYRYRGSYPGYGSPYGAYRPGFSVWGSYGHPHGGYYGSPYYGSPYYGYPTHRTHPAPRPHTPTTQRPSGGPWREADELIHRRRGGDQPMPSPSGAQLMERPRFQPSPMGPRMDGGRASMPMPRMGRDGGSSMGEMIRRGRREGGNE